MIQLGIDEAGLGPILGPLVTAGVALETPGRGRDLFDLLGRVVARKGKKPRETRILVDDSKKVFSGKKGLARLERTALAFMSLAWGSPPTTGEELAGRLLSGGSPQERSSCPWLSPLDFPLPLAASADKVELDSWLLAKAARETGIRLHALYLAALHPREFNASIDRTGNKSLTHFEAFIQVMKAGLQKRPSRVVLDRAGGRIHYALPLARAFPGAGVISREENPARQRYLLRLPQGPQVEVWFQEKGESHFFSIALASCLAKYVREVFMEAMNRWFQERIPGLRPTRGYFVDGRRFLREVHQVAQKERVAEEAFLRKR